MTTGATLGELADCAGATLDGGNPATRVLRVQTLERAGPDAVAFLANPRYRRQLAGARAAAVILAPEMAGECPVPRLVHRNPYAAYARIAQCLQARRAEPGPVGVHQTAVVDPSAQLGERSWIGPQAVVGPGCVLGAGVSVGPGCVLGREVVLGDNSRLVARVTLGDRVRIGARALIHPGVVIGADGFGFAPDQGVWLKVPQTGAVRIGDDVEIGANTAIDRGALDDTVIGDGVKLDNLIQVGHNVQIGDHTVVAAATAIAGSARIGRHCTIAGAVGIAGHIEIADGVTITAMTLVTHSLPEPGVYSSGTPIDTNARWHRNAARFGQLDDIAKRLRRLERAGADDKT